MKKHSARKQRERIVTLTMLENQAWEAEFNHQQEMNQTDKVADERAWLAVQQRFPRLLSYNGCR